MRRFVLTALALAVVVIAAQPAQSASFDFLATLDGGQEVPPNASPGFGVGEFSYDDVANDLSYNIVYGGLQAAVTAAHIHAAPAGVNGAVVFPFVPNTSPMVGVWNDLSAQNVADLFAGNLYVNVHTTMFPGGEIRGQIVSAAVPEPGALVLAASGLAGVGAFRWRRTRRA